MVIKKLSGLISPTTDAYSARLNKLFGLGQDGSIVYASGVTHLTRDFYFTNLTVNSGATLFTNGFKIFVKETLTNNGTIGMPSGTSQTTSVMAGTVVTRNDGNISYNSANAVGGSITVSQITNFDELIAGSRAVGAELQQIFAGAVGATGAAGNPGSAGTANPGGADTGGGSTAGNPGTAGTAGTGGTGGAGGQGGGMVLILAKVVTGSGTFVSEGTVGAAGNPGNPGNAGTAGNAGSTSPGTAVPGNPFSHANPPVHHATHTAGNPFSHINPPTSGHNPDVAGHKVVGNIAAPYPFHAPGNPFHSVTGHNPSSHTAAHHRPARNTPPKTGAAHDPAHFRPGTAIHGQGHNAARAQIGHYTHNTHFHITPTHHIGTPFSHANPDTTGTNPAVNGHAQAPGTPTTGTNPTTHNATYPGGAAGTANPGTAGNAGATGDTGQVGAVVVLSQSITESTNPSTLLKDIH
jgi:hypothetical protein